jgi:hypothetical protein
MWRVITCALVDPVPETINNSRLHYRTTTSGVVTCAKGVLTTSV